MTTSNQPSFWLMKSEPEEFSIEDLCRVKTEPWTGIRNYQVRNFFTRDFKINDLALFYHSNSKPSGVSGLMKITSQAFPDQTAFDTDSEYYDPKSEKDSPTWFAVNVSFIEQFNRFVSLEDLKNNPALKDMGVIRKGNRLSVQPVSAAEFKIILTMAGSGFKV